VSGLSLWADLGPEDEPQLVEVAGCDDLLTTEKSEREIECERESERER